MTATPTRHRSVRHLNEVAPYTWEVVVTTARGISARVPLGGPLSARNAVSKAWALGYPVAAPAPPRGRSRGSLGPLWVLEPR